MRPMASIPDILKQVLVMMKKVDEVGQRRLKIQAMTVAGQPLVDWWGTIACGAVPAYLGYLGSFPRLVLVLDIPHWWEEGVGF